MLHLPDIQGYRHDSIEDNYIGEEDQQRYNSGPFSHRAILCIQIGSRYIALPREINLELIVYHRFKYATGYGTHQAHAQKTYKNLKKKTTKMKS